MATEGQTFDQWLKNAKVPRRALSRQQLAVLQAAFGFLQRCGSDYYSLRMLRHFLLNCDAGLKVAQVARLVNVSRQTASRQQKLSSKQVVQSAHNRMAGRPYGNSCRGTPVRLLSFSSAIPTPHAERLSTSSNAPGTCMCPRWPCTIS